MTSTTTGGDSLPEEGFPVDVRATFGGLRFLPFLALGHNNLNPAFRVFEEKLEIRLLTRASVPYDAIERIDASNGPGTNNVTIVRRRALQTLTANLRRREDQAWVLAFLGHKGVPLTPAATRVADEWQPTPGS